MPRPAAKGRQKSNKVIGWSEDATRFYGTISARGGSQSGDGGFVEVFGKGWLDFRGLVKLGAATGKSGTLLLDPNSVTINDVGPDTGSFRPRDAQHVATVDEVLAVLELVTETAATGVPGEDQKEEKRHRGLQLTNNLQNISCLATACDTLFGAKGRAVSELVFSPQGYGQRRRIVCKITN